MLLIFCEYSSPRLLYVLDWISVQWEMKFQITNSEEEFRKWNGAKLKYREELKEEGALQVEPSGLLESSEIKNFNLYFERINDLPVLFRNKSEFGFDVFSSIFFMLSRYEEYLEHTPDAHGRFSAENSVAFSFGFLDIPVVDIWLDYLEKNLKKRFPELKFPPARFYSLFTYDIDLACKFKGRSFYKSIGGMVRDVLKGDFKNVRDRFFVLFGSKADPWDVHTGILDALPDVGLDTLFFFPAGRQTGFDKNLSPNRGPVKELIGEISNRSEIGLHPSYYSSLRSNLFVEEKARLEKVLPKRISSSRQHFLRFNLPDTFLSLMKCGITKDYSMAFADRPGFRAGTSRPFYFYDLKNEQATVLQIFPPCCMDYTFIHYLKYDVTKSMEAMNNLLKVIRQFGGTFIPVFHNHCLESKEWRSLHASLIREVLAIQEQEEYSAEMIRQNK